MATFLSRCSRDDEMKVTGLNNHFGYVSILG